ncbi:MAG: choice-of-anchor D domain-containing protein, partial [Lysobacter sp.]|nr:choice-of-anchor D domain-containing protein [Lysobacter sp.]
MPGIADAHACPRPSSGGDGRGESILQVARHGARRLLGSDQRLNRAGTAFVAAVSLLSASFVATSATPAVSISAGAEHACAILNTGRAQCWGTNIAGALGQGYFSTESRYPLDVSGFTSGAAEVATGFYTSCAITTTGALKCWGDNGAGKLGTNATASSPLPVDVLGMASGVTSVSVGDNHVCAVVSGAAKCWGRNDYGQLGDGTQADRAAPVQVTGLTSGVLAIAAGREHSCAVVSGGSVRCWGRGYEGQLGAGAFSNSLTPVIVAGVSAVSVTAGAYHTCARTSSGGAKCWGSNTSGELGLGNRPTSFEASPLDVVGLASGVTSLSAGGAHTCAVAGGAVKCWGWNVVGQLGTGNTTDAIVPAAVSGLASGASRVSAGQSHSCAVKTDGTVYCWGSNDYGKLGNGTAVAMSSTPVQVAIDPAAPGAPAINSIVPGDRQAVISFSPSATGGIPILDYRVECAAPGFPTYADTTVSSPFQVPLSANGIAFSCTVSARNAIGRGPASAPQSVTPIATPDSPRVLGVVPGGGWLLVSFVPPANGGSPITGYTATCISSGALETVSAQGTTDSIVVHGLTLGTPYACTVSATNAAGTGPASVPWSPVAPDAGLLAPVNPSSDVIRFRARPIGSQAAPVPLTLSNSSAALRNFMVATSSTEFSVAGCGLATPVAGATSTTLTLAAGATCALELRFTPSAAGTRSGTLMVSVPGWLNARNVRLVGYGSPIAAGFNFTLRLLESGQVTAFGANESGQLGNGSTVNARFPVRAGALSNVVSIAAGHRHAVALREDGTIWTWGLNESNQLGYASTEACISGRSSASASYLGQPGAVPCSSQPKQVPGMDGVVAISAGYTFTTVLRHDGSVWSWGNNRMGALGRSNARVPYAAHGPVSGVGEGIVDLASRGLHTVARSRYGTLRAWGATSLAEGSQSSVEGLPPIEAVAVGFAHNLALDVNGKVWAWGWGTFGQLGDASAESTIPNRSVPYQLLASVPDIVEVSAGYAFSFARRANGTVFAWGNGELGQLGAAAPDICVANIVNGAQAACARAPIVSTALAGVVGVYGGGAHTIGLRADGSLVGLGANGGGQRGDGGGNFGLVDQRSAFDPGVHTFYYHCDECGQVVAGAPPTPTSTATRSTTGPIAVQPLSGLSFGGAQLVGTLSATQAVEVTNVSTSAETFAITSVGATGDFSAEGCGQTIAPGASCTIGVRFAPSGLGLRVGTISLSSDLPDYASLSFDLGGFGVSVPDAPSAVSATPGNGHATIAFQAPASDGGSPITNFSATCSPGSIGASGSQSPLVVAGLANGTTYSCTVVATSTIGSSSPSAAVTVMPFIPATNVAANTSLLSFGGQSIRTTAPAQAVTISNTGSSSMTVASVTASPTDYGVTHDCATLASGATCTATVTFTPSSQGTLAGTLTVNVDSGTLLVPLSGTGERSLVTHYYRSILGRAPDGGGKAYWESEATRMASLGANVNETWYAMAVFFFTSPEYLGLNRDNNG